MNITFNLDEAQIYLPSGKIMNLKDKLGWSSLELSTEEIKQVLINVESHSFEMNLNFEKFKTDLIQQFMHESEQIWLRKDFYKTLATKQLDELDYLKIHEDNLIDQFQGLLSDISEDIKKNKQFIEKMQKLDRLKLINS